VYCTKACPGKKLPFYFTTTVELTAYTTTKIDVKNNIKRTPKIEPTMMDPELFRKTAQEKIAMKAPVDTKTLYNIEEKDIQVGLDDFNIIKVLGRGAYGKVMLVERKKTG